jgi:hypothetical protein
MVFYVLLYFVVVTTYKNCDLLKPHPFGGAEKELWFN